MKEKRFEVLYSQGSLSTLKIIADTETGVQSLSVQNGYAGKLTPLLDREPMVAPVGVGGENQK